MVLLLAYIRVSDASQTHDLQWDAVQQAGADRVFVETASGARRDRPELAKLLEQARPGDIILLWRLDRLARSLRHLIDLSANFQQRGIALRSLTENIDTTTSGGRFLFNVLGSLAEMEREIIVERTRAGLEAARARGRIGGRPPALDESQVRAARAMLASGTMTAAEIARQLGCALSTLYRHLPGGRARLDQQAA